MIIDLTTSIPSDSPLVEKAKMADNPHVAMGHIGTHLDTYNKTAIPLEYFSCEGVVFDVRGIPEVDCLDIDMEKIRENQFVIFRTGRIEECEYGEKAYFHDHPQLSKKLIDKLIERRVRFIGIDCSGIRQHEEHTPTDKLCEDNGVYVIENLNCSALEGCEAVKIYTMWLDDPVMTGLKCRVIAEV